MTADQECVLVTGAGGFIGERLCRRLVGLGARTWGVSRKRAEGENPDVSWRQGDLADWNTAEGIVEEIRPAVVFHLASHVAGSRDLEMVLPTFHSNLATTINLMAAAARVGCRRFVLAGSLEEPPPEEPNAIPSSPYAAAKWASSGYARMFHALYRLPVVTLRIFMVYGPGQKDLKKLVPYTILSLLEGETPRLANGRRPVDWIYVDDVVDALLAAASAPDVEGSTLDVGSGQLVPVREVVERLVRMTGSRVEPDFGAFPERPMEQVRVADTERTLDLTGWKAATTLDKGLERTIHYLKSRGGTRR